MVNQNDDFPFDRGENPSVGGEDQLAPSKSALKRQMLQLQGLADAVSKLKEDEIAEFDLPESLQESLASVQKMKSSSARNRQLRHTSKLLSKCNEELVVSLHCYFKAKQKKAESYTRHHKLVESWRDKLLENPDQGVNALLEKFPNAERQEIRTLARLAAKEKRLNKPPTQQRKLFRYLRDKVMP